MVDKFSLSKYVCGRRRMDNIYVFESESLQIHVHVLDIATSDGAGLAFIYTGHKDNHPVNQSACKHVSNVFGISLSLPYLENNCPVFDADACPVLHPSPMITATYYMHVVPSGRPPALRISMYLCSITRKTMRTEITSTPVSLYHVDQSNSSGRL